MTRRILQLTTLLAAAAASTAYGAVSITASAVAPPIGLDDQYNLVDDLQIPGGDTPGGGTYNSQSYSDNGGPPGQTFTTPNAAAGYKLNSASFLGTGDAGGGSLAGAWGVRISSVSGTALTSLNTVTGIAGPGGATANTDWVTLTFSAGDAVTLNPGTQYAVEVFSQDGWWGIGGTLDAGYAGGTAFNSAGAARGFADATTGNLANHGYDRAFHVGLRAVPEPASVALLGLAGLGLGTRRRR